MLSWSRARYGLGHRCCYRIGCHVKRCVNPIKPLPRTSRRSLTNASNERDVLEQWADNCVIGMRLCPFAAPVRTRNTFRIVTCHAECLNELQDTISSELDKILDPSLDIETTLIGVDASSGYLDDFGDFLDAASKVESVIGSQTDGIQLAIFHPRSVASLLEHSKPLASMLAKNEDFSNRDINPSDMPTRAPLPAFHLLRTEDIVDVVESYPKAQLIPERNAMRLQRWMADHSSKLQPFVDLGLLPQSKVIPKADK